MSGQSRHATHDASRVAEDRALFARYLDQRDPVDREMLVERFLPLARQLARRYQRPDEPFDDLFQVACLGLINAIDRFSLEREVAFSSYAVPTILGEIKRYFRDRTWSVRVPRDLQDLALKVDRAVSELDLELQRKPTVEEIGAKVGADAGGTSSRRSRPRAPTGPRRCRRPGAPMRTAATPWATSSASRSAGFALAEDRATIDARHAGHHAARARGPAPALRRGPHPGRDRRADRRLADAGLAHHPPVGLAPARLRRGRRRGSVAA